MLFNVVFVVSLAYLPVFCRSLEMAVPPSVQSNATADRELLRKNGLCFLSAASDNHFDDLLAHIESVQFMYPCFPMYIANLGLHHQRLILLKKQPFVHVINLRMDRPYFQHGACVFKPVLIHQFLTKAAFPHNCQIVSYGDASIRMLAPFDGIALEEVKRSGLVANHPGRWAGSQISMTHPDMFPFFHLNREEDYKAKTTLIQSMAGLILIDVNNAKMIDSFFSPWAKCALNSQCISPHGFRTTRRSNKALPLFPLESGKLVFRGHRDDQSAFTFLIDSHFGRGTNNTQQVFLNDYVRPMWKSTSSLMQFATYMPPLMDELMKTKMCENLFY